MRSSPLPLLLLSVAWSACAARIDLGGPFPSPTPSPSPSDEPPAIGFSPERPLVDRITPVADVPTGRSAIAWNGTVYLAAWPSDGGLRAARIGRDGTLLDPSGLLLAPPSQAGVPHIAARRSSFVVAWNDAHRGEALVRMVEVDAATGLVTSLRSDGLGTNTDPDVFDIDTFDDRVIVASRNVDYPGLPDGIVVTIATQHSEGPAPWRLSFEARPISALELVHDGARGFVAWVEEGVSPGDPRVLARTLDLATGTMASATQELAVLTSAEAPDLGCALREGRGVCVFRERDAAVVTPWTGATEDLRLLARPLTLDGERIALGDVVWRGRGSVYLGPPPYPPVPPSRISVTALGRSFVSENANLGTHSLLRWERETFAQTEIAGDDGAWIVAHGAHEDDLLVLRNDLARGLRIDLMHDAVDAPWSSVVVNGLRPPQSNPAAGCAGDTCIATWTSRNVVYGRRYDRTAMTARDAEPLALIPSGVVPNASQLVPLPDRFILLWTVDQSGSRQTWASMIPLRGEPDEPRLLVAGLPLTSLLAAAAQSGLVLQMPTTWSDDGEGDLAFYDRDLRLVRRLRRPDHGGASMVALASSDHGLFIVTEDAHVLATTDVWYWPEGAAAPTEHTVLSHRASMRVATSEGRLLVAWTAERGAADTDGFIAAALLDERGRLIGELERPSERGIDAELCAVVGNAQGFLIAWRSRRYDDPFDLQVTQLTREGAPRATFSTPTDELFGTGVALAALDEQRAWLVRGRLYPQRDAMFRDTSRQLVDQVVTFSPTVAPPL